MSDVVTGTKQPYAYRMFNISIPVHSTHGNTDNTC